MGINILFFYRSPVFDVKGQNLKAQPTTFFEKYSVLAMTAEHMELNRICFSLPLYSFLPMKRNFKIMNDGKVSGKPGQNKNSVELCLVSALPEKTNLCLSSWKCWKWLPPIKALTPSPLLSQSRWLFQNFKSWVTVQLLML